MKLQVLTDNMAGGDFCAEHGLSFFIESEETKLLFDTGHSDLFLQNARKIGLEILKDTDAVVLSHGHWDHGDGLQFISEMKLVLHPDALMKRYRKRDNSYVGLMLSRAELQQKFNLVFSTKPFKITNSIFFLGEIPRLNDFEAKTTAFIDENGNDDFVPDDSALAIVENGELTIVSGCSHAGICNITDYAKKVTGVSRVKAVIGGFHLKSDGDQTQRTIEYFKANSIKRIFPCHCTEMPAMAAFYRVFKFEQIRTGMTIIP